ncbi:hypothetical protein R1sor_026128 [Riccia sorocarpa]|uniref:Uncharacterized protein n=1 Tax=Riccia sorocarpa TaxID=122646 RepID=A0ABD3GDT4_9MARC
MAAQAAAKLGWDVCTFSFGMVMRFFGRYPETARSYYKPPEDVLSHQQQGGPRHEPGIQSFLDQTHSHSQPQQQAHHDDSREIRFLSCSNTGKQKFGIRTSRVKLTPDPLVRNSSVSVRR